MGNDLKSDLIKDGYSQLRISGLTVNPGAESNQLALERLENMAAEFFDRDICVGYFFEVDPDPTTPCGLKRSYKYAFSCILAVRLLSDFGKGFKPDPSLFTNAAAQMSFLYSQTAKMPKTEYPSRMPVGSGNHYYCRIRRWYSPIAEDTDACQIIEKDPNDRLDYINNWALWLKTDDYITASVWTVPSGITKVSDSFTTETTTIWLSGGTLGNSYDVVNTITTNDGRTKDFTLTVLIVEA